MRFLTKLLRQLGVEHKLLGASACLLAGLVLTPNAATLAFALLGLWWAKRVARSVVGPLAQLELASSASKRPSSARNISPSTTS